MAIAFFPRVIVAQDDGQTASVDSKTVDRLVNEIESLIPGEYAEGSEEKQLVVQVATAYLERNASKTVKLLEELALKDPAMPPQNLLLAGISFATNNAQQGRNLLERVGADNRNHPGVALAFARLALLQGRYYEAMALAELANKLTESPSLGEKARKYYAIEAHNSMTVIEMRRNDLVRASDLAKKWAELAPQSDEMFLASAEIAFQNSEFEMAIELLGKRSTATKQKLSTEIVMAKWYRAKNDYKLLEKWVNEAYEKSPENPVVQLEYASWLLRNGKYDEVEKVVSAFELKHGGASLDSTSLRGRVAFGRKQYEAAAADFGKIFRQQPNNFENSAIYVFALLETSSAENQQQGIGLAQRNFQAFPNSQLAALAMSVALAKAGKNDVAGQLLERAARMGNILPDTAYFLARNLNRDDRGLQARIMLDPFMESKDMFLYRERAQELIDTIGGKTDESLPDPGNEGGK